MPTQGPLTPALLLSGARVPVLVMEEHTLRGTGASSDQTSGHLSSNLGPHSATNSVLMVAKQRSPGSHLDPALAPPSLAPPPTKVIVVSQRKDMTCAYQIQLSQQIHWAHTDCIGTLSHKDIPLGHVR